MKNTFLVALFLLVTNFIQAQNLVWHTDATKAIEQSYKLKKPILLFFTGSDWCGWCIKLQREVFSQDEFKKWAKENVVLLELDFPRRNEQPNEIKNQNSQIQQVFSISGYPTIWFASAQNNEGKITFNPIGSLGYIAGGPQKWIEAAKSVLTKKNK